MHAMKISYCSEAVCLTIVPNKNAALISITEPNREAPIVTEGWGALLRVRFLDAELEKDMIVRLQEKNKNFSLKNKGFPHREVSEQVIEFLRSIKNQITIDEIIVHCKAGQRRSAAVAKYAAEMFNAEFDHSYDQYNVMVYELLRNPAMFDDVIAPDVGDSFIQKIKKSIFKVRL